MNGPRHTAPRTSLRVRLALSYAGIALLSVAVLGGVLLLVLGQYFRQSEDLYLRAVAERASFDVVRADTTATDMQRAASVLALMSQTRVRVYDVSGALVADSGLPAEIDPELLAPPERDRSDRGIDGRRDFPSPLGSGIFGSRATSGAPRSDRVLRTILTDAAGEGVGSVLLSDGPASGRDVLASIVEALALAALAAMALAGSAGYALSSRISHPIVELTAASDEMAAGNLSVRTGIERDDEVGHLARSFNAMADRVEATVVTLRRFVADAAHEIGTPLTALQADLELADAAGSESEEREFVKRALGQARRIEDLSANLLRLSRIEAGEFVSEEASLDLVPMVRGIGDAAASRAEQAGVELTLAVAGDEPVRVAAEESRMRAAVENLLDNAFKFTPEGGGVELGLRAEGGHAVLWVSDSGIGIPAAEQPEVFGRFYRARNVASYPGSGLGLAIVLATIEGYGGTVGFRSSDAGTRFEARLPLA